MDATCPKCGSDEILLDVPVVSSSDQFSAVPVSALVYNKPDAWIFKGPSPHRFVARICGGCGFAEFYVEDPKGLAATIKRNDS
jgi:predicted nucleic-acid-binding Zn-ribbon protein